MAETKSTTPAAKSVDDNKQSPKALVALAPLVSVRDEAGRISYLYRGTPVPAGTPQAELDRLMEMDMIGEDDGTVVPGIAADPRQI